MPGMLGESGAWDWKDWLKLRLFWGEGTGEEPQGEAPAGLSASWREEV